jgi:hypothetical protein
MACRSMNAFSRCVEGWCSLQASRSSMMYLPVAMSSRASSSARRFSVAVMASAVSAGVHSAGARRRATVAAGPTSRSSWPTLDAPPGDPRSLKKFGVRPDVRAPLAGRVVFVEDRLDRAHRLACATVHTLARMDVQRAAACVDAVDRAFLDARPVQYVHARLSDHVGHRRTSARRGHPTSVRGSPCTPTAPAGPALVRRSYPHSDRSTLSGDSAWRGQPSARLLPRGSDRTGAPGTRPAMRAATRGPVEQLLAERQAQPITR